MIILSCLLTNGFEAKAVVKEPLNNTKSTTSISSLSNSDENTDYLFENDEIKEKIINYIIDTKTKQLQNQIIENLSQLQNDIKTAKQHGKKTSLVAKLFKIVSPLNLSGTNNYCTAGAMCAYFQMKDAQIKPIIDGIVASKNTLPKDFKLFSHPNISCPAFREYYKKKLGSNFFDRKSTDFQQKIKSLEKGDVLMIYSSQNTSSNLHCVTFEKYDGDMLCVKSLNNENDYEIKPSKVCCVAKFVNQFRQNLSNELHRNNEFFNSIIKNDPLLYKRISEKTIRPVKSNEDLFHINTQTL